MTEKIDTHDLRIGFGKHKGEFWIHLPSHYLRWIASTPVNKPDIIQIALVELDRREQGRSDREVEISSHAIDQASFRCLKHWRADRQEDEGLYSWLRRITLEAVEHGTLEEDESDGRLLWKNMCLLITMKNPLILVSLFSRGAPLRKEVI